MSTIDSSRRCRTFNSRKAAKARAKATGIRINFMESSFCGVEWRFRRVSVNQRKITDVIGNGPGWTWSTSPKTCKATNGSQLEGWGVRVMTKMPRNIFRYVLETSGLHQLFLLLLTVGVFLLEVVPLELQRRIVNDLVKHLDYRLVLILCAVYAGAVLRAGVHQAGPQRLSQLGRRTCNP